MFASADGMTISVQVGNLHPNTNEMQYIVAGTDTIWLGEKEVRVLQRLGDNTKPESSVFKAIVIKTPPQAPNDMTLLP